MICDGCGRETYRLTSPEKSRKWLCSRCYHPSPGTLLNVKFCEGNPGHGFISVAYARRQNRLKLARKPDGGNIMYENFNPHSIQMTGWKGFAADGRVAG